MINREAFSWRLALILLALVLLLQMGWALRSVGAAGTNYYVSRLGNNADGGTWATAWNELDQIDWNVIQPGDTILIDGGSTECSFPVAVAGNSNAPQGTAGGDCGMVYASTLTIGASGQPGDPITIKLADEPGRDGTVLMFGGRSTPLPYCGQVGYTFEAASSVGIAIGGYSWVIIDGARWAGMMIYGHNRNGIRMYPGANNVTVRNVEIYDNGTALQIGSTWEPDLAAVELLGTDIAFEQVILHDSGQDAFQSPGIVSGFSLNRSWLHNSRPHPNNPTRAFNDCRHSDGIQIYGGGIQSGVLIQDSIIGPGFMQGVMLGGGGQPNPPWAVINDVTIRNSLFFKSSNAEIHSNSNSTNPVNWRIENVTSFAQEDREWHNVYLEGTQHVIQDSVFYGGRSMSFPDWNFVTDGNCQWNVGGKIVGLIADPQFVNADENNWFSLDDFTVQNSACKGSSITSVAQLLGQPAPTPVPTDSAPTTTPTPLPTSVPVPTATPVPTTTPLPTTFVIDDADPGFATAYSQDAWQEYQEAAGQHYGGAHFFNSQIGSGGDIATWTFALPQSGIYRVYAWWYEGSWRPSDVPYTVNYFGGSTTVRVNQQVDGGQWNLLGLFRFAEVGSIVISDDVSSGQDVAADAVKIEYQEPLPRGNLPAFYLPYVRR